MIVYRDDNGGGRSPHWLGECARRGNESCRCESYIFPDTSGVEWHAVEDGFSAAIAGDIQPLDLLYGQSDAELILCDSTRCACLPVRDLADRVWLIPAAMIDGHPVIKAAWRIDDSGNYRRSPTAAQEVLLDISSQIYEMAGRGEASEMPLPAIAQWASKIICLAYRLSPLTIGRLGILDDLLAPAAIMAVAGLTPETVEDGYI